MGEGHDETQDRLAAARLYAAAGGGLLVILGLVGLLVSADFATGNEMTTASLGPLELNGWQAIFYVIAGLTGLALAARGPRLYCLAAASIWALLTAFGFFGAHGGEVIPTMGDRLLATTSNNVLALALALLGFAAYAASAPARTKSAQRAPKRKLGEGGKRSIGRPRTSGRSPGSGKGETIN